MLEKRGWVPETVGSYVQDIASDTAQAASADLDPEVRH